jgi:hypothetical protein
MAATGLVVILVAYAFLLQRVLVIQTEITNSEDNVHDLRKSKF